MRARYPQRLKGFSYLGCYRYALRFCTDRRQRLFVEPATVDLVRSQIARSASESAIAVVAYCFMPDHLHLLVEGTSDDSDCRRFIVNAKRYSGFYFAQAFHMRLWQRYGFERVLRSGEPTHVVARYILENPIRGGLVSRIQDYPFVGSLVYTTQELIHSVCASPD